MLVVISMLVNVMVEVEGMFTIWKKISHNLNISSTNLEGKM